MIEAFPKPGVSMYKPNENEHKKAQETDEEVE